MTIGRLEVERTIAADPATIFRLLCDPRGHVAIDSSGMLLSATGVPVTAVGDSFVVRHDAPSIFAGHYDPSFSLDLCLKDLGLIGELGQQVKAELPMTDAARHAFATAAQRYGAQAAELHVAKRIEDDANLSMRLQGDWTPPWEQ